MVAFASSLLGTAALFVGYASALPRPEWASSSDWSSNAEGAAAKSSVVASSAVESWGAASIDSNSWAPASSAGLSSGSSSDSSWGSSPDSSSGSTWGSSPGSSSGSSWGSSPDSSSGSSSGSSWGSSSGSSSESSWQSPDSVSSDVMSAATAVSSDYVWSTSATAAAMSSDVIWSSAATYTAAATATVSYGSGSSSWGGSGYANCVQQCIASFGAPSATVTAAATATAYSGSSSSGSGTTHTVIVAPTQGVLRFVPFAVNATPGDTVLYMWNANNHTVTKGSELEICNETSDSPFATGEHDKGFTFTETVNDTSPVFFFCSTPGHCEKGMFGIINPPSVENNANTSVATMMSSIMSNSSTLAAMYAASNISSNPMAASWGESINMGSMPEWSQSLFAENVLYTRAFLAANPAVMQPDGSIDMSATNGSWTLPQDISQALSSNSTSGSSSASAGASSTATSSSATVSSTATVKSGAGSNSVSGALLSVAVIAATFLAL